MCPSCRKADILSEADEDERKREFEDSYLKKMMTALTKNVAIMSKQMEKLLSVPKDLEELKHSVK